MNWTTDLPKVDGYYWWRRNKYKQECIYYVFSSHSDSIIKENEERASKALTPLSRYESIIHVQDHNRVMYCRWSGAALADKERPVDVGGEWLGPLTPEA